MWWERWCWWYLRFHSSGDVLLSCLSQSYLFRTEIQRRHRLHAGSCSLEETCTHTMGPLSLLLACRRLLLIFRHEKSHSRMQFSPKKIVFGLSTYTIWVFLSTAIFRLIPPPRAESLPSSDEPGQDEKEQKIVVGGRIFAEIVPSLFAGQTGRILQVRIHRRSDLQRKQMSSNVTSLCPCLCPQNCWPTHLNPSQPIPTRPICYRLNPLGSFHHNDQSSLDGQESSWVQL